MIIQIEEKYYELSGEEFEKIFEEAKKHVHNIIDSCERKRYDEKEVFLTLMSIHSQTNTLISNMINRIGREEFSKMIGAKQLYDNH